MFHHRACPQHALDQRIRKLGKATFRTGAIDHSPYLNPG
jgi:hypothetical protein